HDQGAAPLEAQRQSLEQMARQLAADSKRWQALSANAGRWFSYPKRTTPGIALAGTVQNVEQVGKLFCATIKLGPSADVPAVTVVSAHDPRLAASDQALTLGSIVEAPQENLAGYEGTEPAVVWSGLTLKIPPGGQ